MTEVATSDFRHPPRYVRLDTILRLRWLAVLGQLAAIFIVAQGLEFDVAVVPCVTIVGLSALLNLALRDINLCYASATGNVRAAYFAR